MLRVITFNANGIRAAHRKGFFRWLQNQRADVVCIQEIKAKTLQLADPDFHPEGYHCFYNEAERPGYAGTAVYCLKKPTKVVTRLDWDIVDREGRYTQVDFDGFSVVSLYVPSGSSSELAQSRKDGFMEPFYQHLKKLRRKKREFIVCADWNTCFREVDLKNWRSNQKNSGFMPHERAWLGRIFGRLKWIDIFRQITDESELYTWWSNRGQAWDKNVGWRLDYMLVTPGLSGTGIRQEIYRDERFSDHAPLTIDFNLPPM